MEEDDISPNYGDFSEYHSGYDRTASTAFEISKGRTWADWPFQAEEPANRWSTEFDNRDYLWGTGDLNAGGQSCLSTAGEPPDTGTFVLGSIDGECQWIDTTTCS